MLNLANHYYFRVTNDYTSSALFPALARLVGPNISCWVGQLRTYNDVLQFDPEPRLVRSSESNCITVLNVRSILWSTKRLLQIDPGNEI
jgi:hypothetical protein